MSELPVAAWKDTYDTLHMWTQIVGKVRLKLSPFVNHWWEAALYMTPRGLTTSPMPYEGRSLSIDFDFTDDLLAIECDDGTKRAMALCPRTVADFHRELVSLLDSLGVAVAIDLEPKEVEGPIPFDKDTVHSSYDPVAVRTWFRMMLRAHRLMEQFRSRFIGKCSPVHFFWGSFDLCVTRFSGRRAPPRPEADHITQVAYSHEVSSCGFWPGSGNILEPAYYSYAAPAPAGFEKAPAKPDEAFWNPPTQGFILRHDDAHPDGAVLDFFESTYEAAAELGRWDRASLERRSKKAA
jgi:hypothetical protein